MIKGKKREAEAAGDNQAKKPKFDKKAPAKGKFDAQNAEKRPFKKPFKKPFNKSGASLHIDQKLS